MTITTASVVLYNTPEPQLRRLLDCIQRSSACQLVFLIDNSPNQVDLPIFHSPGIVYIKSGANVGYGAGHNIALRLAFQNSEFHFVLNPDIYFGPDELYRMIQRMKLDSRVGQLMPKVTYPDGSLQYLCKLIPTPVDLIFRRFLIGPFKSFANKRMERFELRNTGYDQEMDVPYLSGCFMLFRMSALKEVGLFDEQFFMYPEDIDITRRMNKIYRTIYYPQATITHDHAKESYSSYKMLLIHIWNLIKYFNKWGWIFDKQRKITNKIVLQSMGSGHESIIRK